MVITKKTAHVGCVYFAGGAGDIKNNGFVNQCYRNRLYISSDLDTMEQERGILTYWTYDLGKTINEDSADRTAVLIYTKMGSDTANITTGRNAHALDVLLECDYDYAVTTNLRNADIRGARIQAYGHNNVSGVVMGAYINAQLEGGYTFGGQIREGIASFGGVGLEVRLETTGSGTVVIADTGSGPQIAVALLVSTRIANALTGNVAGIWVEKPYEGTTNVSLALTGILFADNGLYATGDTTDWDIGIDLGDTCTIGIDIDDCTTGINMADATVGGDDIVLSATGVINAATSIIFEIGGTPVVTITSSGWGDVVPSTITSTTDPQFTIKYDAQEYMTLGVSSAGVCKIKTYAAGVDTFEVEADGIITLDAGTDIHLEPAGADVFIDQAGFTVSTTQLTVFGGDTSADDLVLRANSTDANPLITLNGLGDITFNAPFIGTLANSSNDNLVELNITDTSTSGETNGLYIQVDRNGALTAADYTIGGNFRVRVGAATNHAGAVYAGIWTSTGVTGGTPTLGTLTGIYVWANQTTGTVTEHLGISVNMDFDNSATNDHYFKVYNHGTALGDSIIWFGNSGVGAATFLLDFEAALAPFSGTYYDIAIREGANTRYIPTGNATEGLLLSRDYATYGINLSTAGLTAGIILSGAAGASHIQMSGTATDGLLIDGVCTDGIHISSACSTYGINLAGDCDTGIYIDAQTTYGIHLHDSLIYSDYSGMMPASGSTSYLKLSGTRTQAGTGTTDRAIDIFMNNNTTNTGEMIGVKVNLRNTGTIGTIRGFEARTDQRDTATTIVQLMGFHNEMRIYAGEASPSGFFASFYANMQVHADVDAGALNAAFLARDFSSGTYTGVTAAFKAAKANTISTGFQYILDCYDEISTFQTWGTAQIRLGKVSAEDVVIVTGDFTEGADSGFAPGSIGLDTADGKFFVSDSSGNWQEPTMS